MWVPFVVVLLGIALGVWEIGKGPAYDRRHDLEGRWVPTRQLGYYALFGSLMALAFWLIALATGQAR